MMQIFVILNGFNPGIQGEKVISPETNFIPLKMKPRNTLGLIEEIKKAKSEGQTI